MLTPEVQQQVITGDDAETFVASELGQAVLAISAQDLDAAILGFAEVDATDIAKVRELQLQVRIGMRFEQYLKEIIEKGREALEANKDVTQD